MVRKKVAPSRFQGAINSPSDETVYHDNEDGKESNDMHNEKRRHALLRSFIQINQLSALSCNVILSVSVAPTASCCKLRIILPFR